MGALPGARPVVPPITFERNDGQFEPGVLFAAQGTHGRLVVRAGEMLIGRGGSTPPVRLRMVAANPASEVHPEALLATRTHDYTGSTRIENIPHFASLRVKDIYPGIDIALHGRDGELEYDFLVAPGADPRDIRIDLRDLDATIDAQGNLRIVRDGQELLQRTPVAYQGEAHQRVPVASHFELVGAEGGKEARIVLGPYDPRRPLTIDPVIEYSTLAGGAGGFTVLMKLDAEGRIHYAYTEPDERRTQVLKCLDPATNTLLYETRFGGAATTTLVGALAVDPTVPGRVYVGGVTASSDFPAPGPTTSTQAFIAALTPQGMFEQGVRFGGSVFDSVNALAIDNSGNVFVGGETASADFPVTGGPPHNGSGIEDAFIGKYDSALRPVYQRLLGGRGPDAVFDIAVDAAGQAIVVGRAGSDDFPVANVKPPASPPPLNFGQRGFAAKLSADGMTILYSQLIGGESIVASGVALDPLTGDALILGGSGNPASFVPTSVLPTPGVAFVVRLSPDGTPTYGALLGGTFRADGIAVNGRGDVYVIGTTQSTNMPVIDPLPGGTILRGNGDAFIVRLRDGQPDFWTYLGGSGLDIGTGIALGSDGAVYVAGNTFSSDFPLVRPLNASLPSPGDGFIAKITGLPAPETRSPLVNISTRAEVGGNTDVMIGGFVIGGAGSKTVAVTAIGPSLLGAGIANALLDPTLTLVRSSDGAVIAVNDDWGTAANAAQIQQAGFAPAHARESAIMMTLPPGAYTAIVAGASGTTGVGMVAVYEVDHPEVPLVNISTRGRVLTGNDVMIGGFVIEGSAPQTVVVTGIGPSLVGAGIPDALANPALTLVRSSDGVVLASNDDWISAPNAAQIQAAGFAPASASESAIMATLPPGAYTAILSGAGNTTGVGIIAVYTLP